MSLPIISPRQKIFSLEESKEHYRELYESLRFKYESFPEVYHYFNPTNEVRFYQHIYPVHSAFRRSFETIDKREIRMNMSFMVISLLFSNYIVDVEKILPRTERHLNLLWKFISGIIRIGMTNENGHGKFDLSIVDYLNRQFPEYSEFCPLLLHPFLSQNLRIFKDGLRQERIPRVISESHDLTSLLCESPIPFQYVHSTLENTLFDREAIQKRLIQLRAEFRQESMSLSRLEQEYEDNKRKIQRLIS
jgi:hypothetical protein